MYRCMCVCMRVTCAYVGVTRLRFSEGHPMVGQAWANLGAIYYEMKDYAKAIDSSKRALSIFEHSGMTGDSTAEREKDVAMTYMNLGHAYVRFCTIWVACGCFLLDLLGTMLYAV